MDGLTTFDELKQVLGEEWPSITEALQQASDHSKRLRTLITDHRPPTNTSVIAFGSLARGEWTVGSDVDWTLLIDGPSDMRHFDVMRSVDDVLSESKYKPPGQSGTFGSMTSSHELVHNIGGVEDSNANLTRRILLLLESIPLSDATTYERVTRSILERYILSDPPATAPGQFRCPLFLFNDIVRFWRTMTVDYATKKWQRNNRGWALRNIKLRLSRKLLFVKGMLMCFLCDPAFSAPTEGKSAEEVEVELLNRCKYFAESRAIDLLSHALSTLAPESTTKKTISAYDRFLGTLNDPDKRKRLGDLPFDQSEDELFAEMRQISRDFRDGINTLFFESDANLERLTKRYGVF